MDEVFVAIGQSTNQIEAVTWSKNLLKDFLQKSKRCRDGGDEATG